MEEINQPTNDRYDHFHGHPSRVCKSKSPASKTESQAWNICRFLFVSSKAKTWFGRPGFVENSRGLDRSLNSCPPKVDGQPDISLGFKKLVTDLPVTNLNQSLKVQLAGDFKHYLDISHPEIWGRGTQTYRSTFWLICFSRWVGNVPPLRRFCHLPKKVGLFGRTFCGWDLLENNMDLMLHSKMGLFFHLKRQVWGSSSRDLVWTIVCNL